MADTQVEDVTGAGNSCCGGFLAAGKSLGQEGVVCIGSKNREHIGQPWGSI